MNLNPKFLVVDPIRWTLYFTNWKNLTTADIYKLTYNLNYLKTNQNIFIPNAGNITSLAIDEKYERLFWSVVVNTEDNDFSSFIYSISITNRKFYY